MNSELHYRLFAKFVLVMAIALGGAIGYFAGLEVGEANALRLIQAGRDAAATTADTKTTDKADPKVVACYEETLGKDHYADIAAGKAEMTVDEVFKILPCTSLSK